MKLKNAKTKDYLGKAKLISATDANDVFTTFTGVTRYNQGLLPSGAPLSELNRTNSTNSSTTTKSAPATFGGRAPVFTPGNVGSAGPSAPEKSSNAVKRSTIIGPPGAGMGGPVRGLTIKRPSTANTPPPQISPPPQQSSFSLRRELSRLNVRDREQDRPPQDDGARSPSSPKKQQPGKRNSTRLTEIYDDYLGGYSNEEPPLPPPPPARTGSPSRLAAWMSKTAPGPPASPTRASSRPTAPPSTFGGSLRRKLTRRPTGSISRGRSRAYDDEEEEGYVSGDYEDWGYELVKIRVKVRFEVSSDCMLHGRCSFSLTLSDTLSGRHARNDDATRVHLPGVCQQSGG